MKTLRFLQWLQVLMILVLIYSNARNIEVNFSMVFTFSLINLGFLEALQREINKKLREDDRS